MATSDEQSDDDKATHARSVAPLVCLIVAACASEPGDIPIVAGECHATDLHDEDGDGIPDTCDDCPGVFDPAQSDTGEALGLAFDDGVGDACDPQPTRGGDRLAEFHSFSTDDTREWIGDGWHIGADAAHAIAPALRRHKVAEVGDGLYVQAHVSIVWLAATGSVRVVADDGDGVGYSCAVVRDRDADGFDELEIADGPGTPTVASLGARVEGPLVITVWRSIDFHREGTVFCRVAYAGIDHEVRLEHLDDFTTGIYSFASEGAITDVGSLAVYTFPIGPCASSNRRCDTPR